MSGRNRIRRENIKYTDPDQAVLNLLKLSNTDLSKKRFMNFYLYFPTEEKTNFAGSELKKLGFIVECNNSSNNDWLCFAKKEIVPNIICLNLIRKKLEYIASKLNGTYNGWKIELSIEESNGFPEFE